MAAAGERVFSRASLELADKQIRVQIMHLRRGGGYEARWKRVVCNISDFTSADRATPKLLQTSFGVRIGSEWVFASTVQGAAFKDVDFL